MPGKQPDFDVMTAGAFMRKIGGAWAFTDKNGNVGYRISLDALPVAYSDEKYGTRTGLVMFKRDDSRPAPEPSGDDMPF